VPVDEVTDRLSAELERVLTVLTGDERVEQVWLTGSMLSGRAHATSDLDLLVVRRTDASPVDRRLELAATLAPQVPLDLFVFTPEEFVAGGRFVGYVMRHGRRLA
jgi:predicted nucleotidyltransferase